MKRVTLVSLTICLILVIVSGASVSTLEDIASETITKAEQHFEKANELLNRKEYKAAVAEFEEVMNISPNSKIAQDAQYWMGQSHFMAGQFDAAQATFAKLIEQYPASAIVAATELMVERIGRAKDIEEKKRAIAEARMRLAALQRDIGNPELTIRKIWGAHGTQNEMMDENTALYWLTWGDDSRPSPDGRYIAYTNWGPPSIGVYDLTAGESRDITDEGTWMEPPTGDEFGHNPIWSPDGRYIAYAWCIYGTKADNLKDHYELRISGLDGTKPRVIYRTDNEEEEIKPYDWSPDGKTILATIEHAKPRSRVITARRIVLISVEDGSKRILKTLEQDFHNTDVLPFSAFFSPDGRYIAYDLEQSSDDLKRDIFLLKTDGSGDSIPLVIHPADDQLLGWAPDGKRLLFATNRTGINTMASIEVHEGQSQGVPQSVRRLEAGFQPIGLTRNGAYYYSVRMGTHDVYTATLDLETGRVVVPPALVNVPIEGQAGIPCWSSDGQSLAYLSSATNAERVSITIRSVETHEVREVEYSAHIKGIAGRFLEWSPDGRSFLIYGVPHRPFTERQGGGLFNMNAQTGDVSLITHAADANEILRMPKWSVDGKSVFYQKLARTGTEYWDFDARILERNLETGKEREIAKDVSAKRPGGGAPYWAEFSLSPDGRRIAFISEETLENDTPSPRLLKVKAIAGGEATELFRTQRIMTLQGWTADGRYILFQDYERGDKKDLWRIPATGGESRKIELTMKGIHYLRVHPDGRQVAFDVEGKNQELWVMENFLPESKAGE